MKTILLAFFTIIASLSKAQITSLSSGVYNLDSIKARSGAASQAKPKVQGSTTDLAMLSFHASTLEAGITNHTPRALDDL